MRATVILIASVVVVGYGHAVPIWGRVVDEECRPLPGAEVWLVRSPPGAPSEVIGRDTPNANGTFVITGSSASATPDAGVTLSLLAYVEGRALGWWGQTGRPVGEQRVLLLCDRATRTGGRIVDGRDGGVAAEVRPTHLHSDGPYGGPRVSLELPDEVSRRLAITTEADGSYLFTACPYHARAYLSAEHPECGQIRLGHGPHCGVMVVSPPGRVRVRVTCAEAPEAVAGLRVSVSGGGEADGEARLPPGRLRARSGGTAVTGPDGVAEVDLVQPGRGVAFAYCTTDARWQSSSAAPEFRVLSGQTTEVRIVLEPAVEVTGRVIDGSTGLPLQGVTVQPYGPAAYSRDSLPVTDADGTYRFLALPGKVRASVVATLQGGAVDSGRSGSVEMTVAEGGGVFPDLVIRDGPRVEGTVVDLFGSPVPEAEVWTDRSLSPPAVCDEQGRFILYLPKPSPPPAGREPRPYSVTLWARGGERMSRQPVEVAVGAAPRLVVEPDVGCRVALRVTDPQGKPVPLAEVQVHYGGSTGPAPNVQRLWGLTEPDGTYRSPLLWPYGAYTVEVTKRQWNTAQSASWACAPGRVHDFGGLVITRAGGVVAGRVVDTAGAAVSGAEVYASGEGPLEVRTRTDAAGAFALDGLWEGRAWVVAVSPNAVGAANVAVGEEDALLPMRPLKPGAVLVPPVPVRSLTDFEADRRVAAELLEEALRRFPPAHEGGIAGFETAYAMLYPERMLKLLERNLWFGLDLAPALAQHGFDVVSRYLATLLDDSWRYQAAVAGLPSMRGEDAGKLASAALGYARNAGKGVRDPRTAARIAEALWEVDRPTAETLLRQIQQSVQAREPADSMHAYALAHAAEALCRLDLPWALEVVERLDTYSPGAEARLGIARRIAATHPAVACRLIDEADALQRAIVWRPGDAWVPDGRLADGDIMRIAYAMAPADPDRALELARGVRSTPLRARALSYVAFALAPHSPERAAHVFEEVLMPIVAALAAGRADVDSPAGYPDVMGDLTCVAYRIGYPEPERVAWLALASRSSRRPKGVVRHLAFAEPPLAAEMVRDAIEQSKLSATPLSGEAVHDLVVAAAAVDANLAAGLVRRLSDTRNSDILTESGAGLWAKAIELLATRPEDRQPTTLGRHYLDWRPWARVAD